MATNKKSFASFSVRLPEDLNQKVEKDCEEEGRNKNQQINWILKKHYEADESAVKSTEKATV